MFHLDRHSTTRNEPHVAIWHYVGVVIAVVSFVSFVTLGAWSSEPAVPLPAVAKAVSH